MHQTRSELDCSHKCLSNPKCASFNFEIQQSQSLSTCELNNVSRISSNNKLKRNDSFAYYEPITPMERSKQEIAAFCPTTSNIITEATTAQGTQEISTSQDQAVTPASSVPSTQSATTATPSKWFAKSKVTHSNCAEAIESLRSIFLETFPAIFIFTTEVLCGCHDAWHWVSTITRPLFIFATLTIHFKDSNLLFPLHMRMTER